MWQRSKRSCKSELLAVLFLWLLVNASIARAQQPGSNPAGLNQSGAFMARPVGNLEDWSSLSLANSDLIPEPPLLGEKDDNNPQFTRELLQVKWRQGDPIDLYVIRPKGVVKPPAILYLYSYPSETDIFRNDTYCARVTKGGFAAIGFVSALNGHRYTNRPMKQWFVSELQEALGSSVHDVQMVLNYLATRGDLDMGRIGMFGVGSGGTIDILAAAADPRIKTIDVIDPWGDWPDWMAKSSIIPEVERPNYVKPEFLKKVAPLDPVKWLPQLTSQHVRLQQVVDDSVTPKVVQRRIRAAAPGTVQKVTFRTTRQFTDAQAGDRLLLWVKGKVQPASQPQPALRTSQNPGARQQSLQLNHIDSKHDEKTGND
ncbi:MAG: CocE/NonD family hydrolase [Terriglobales bacterium]